MDKIKILNISYDISGAVFSEKIVALIEFECENKNNFLTVIEVEGYPIFYLSDSDYIYKKTLENCCDDEFIDYCLDHELSEYGGIKLQNDYNEIYESIEETQKTNSVLLIMLAVAVTRLDIENTKKLISSSKGKFVDEIDIPMTDDDYDD